MGFLEQAAERLDARVNIRLTASEKLQLQENANAAGLGVSELIRRRYFGRKVIARADLQILKELRRQGGLLKHLHNQSGGVYSVETACALRSLQHTFEVLSNDR